jgi:DNA repair exonuclease SbcCD ATPase subunit
LEPSVGAMLGPVVLNLGRVFAPRRLIAGVRRTRCRAKVLEEVVSSQARVGLGLVLACFVPGAGWAQVTPPAASGTLEGVVNEIRLLRRAIEQQSTSTARAQLLIGRLSLQDQRTARARDAVERLEGQLATGERERDQLQAAAREAQRSLEQATDQERRTELEAQSRMIRQQYAKARQRVSEAEGRLARAREALDIETGRYDELDRLLADLDRQLQAGR